MRRAMAQAIREAADARRGSDPGCRRSDSSWGGRSVPADNLHVTLAFLGSVPERRLPELAGIARRAASPGRIACESAEAPRAPLELAFDHLEHWRAAQLLCAAPAEPSMPAAALAGRLQTLLAQSGFGPDLKPFRPHVTVARKVARPGAAGRMQPVVWRFTELALIESRTLPAGALYSVVDSYPLCGADQKVAK